MQPCISAHIQKGSSPSCGTPTGTKRNIQRAATRAGPARADMPYYSRGALSRGHVTYTRTVYYGESVCRSAIALRRVRWEIGDLYFVFFICRVAPAPSSPPCSPRPPPLSGSALCRGAARAVSGVRAQRGVQLYLKKTQSSFSTRFSPVVGPLAPSPTL